MSKIEVYLKKMVRDEETLDSTMYIMEQQVNNPINLKLKMDNIKKSYIKLKDIKSDNLRDAFNEVSSKLNEFDIDNFDDLFPSITFGDLFKIEDKYYYYTEIPNYSFALATVTSKAKKSTEKVTRREKPKEPKPAPKEENEEEMSDEPGEEELEEEADMKE